MHKEKDETLDLNNQIIKIKLSGFLLRDNEPKIIESEAYEIVAEKPSFEVDFQILVYIDIDL